MPVLRYKLSCFRRKPTCCPTCGKFVKRKYNRKRPKSEINQKKVTEPFVKFDGK